MTNLCASCSNPRRVRTHYGGRPMLYCSVDCRRSAEYAERRKTRTFEGLKAEFATVGEDTIRQRIADDPDFAESVIVLVETYLKPPDGRTEVDIDPEALQFLLEPERRFSVIGHDNPLPSDADIDQAELTGDWTPMVKEALASMTWQLAKKYKPDLRGFDIEPVDIDDVKP